MAVSPSNVSGRVVAAVTSVGSQAEGSICVSYMPEMPLYFFAKNFIVTDRFSLEKCVPINQSLPTSGLVLFQKERKKVSRTAFPHWS